MQLELIVDGDITTLKVAGEVRLEETLVFKDKALELIEEGVKNLVLDLVNTDYICSAALGAIVMVFKKLKENGGILKISNPNSNIMQIFRLTRLDKVIEIV